MTEQSRNMFEGMFGIHEKDEPKAKGSGKNHNKKKEDKIQKEIEYTDKERSYINKYLKIAKTAYDEKEIYEIIKKYNFDDDLINKDIKKQLNMIQVKGEEYGWSEVKKKEIKPKTEITNTNNEKEKGSIKASDKNNKKLKKDAKGKIKGKYVIEKINKDKKEEKKEKEEEVYNDDEKYYEQALNNYKNYDEDDNQNYNNYDNKYGNYKKSFSAYNCNSYCCNYSYSENYFYYYNNYYYNYCSYNHIYYYYMH